MVQDENDGLTMKMNLVQGKVSCRSQTSSVKSRPASDHTRVSHFATEHLSTMALQDLPELLYCTVTTASCIASTGSLELDHVHSTEMYVGL